MLRAIECVFVVTAAAACWFVEGMSRFILRNPRTVTGTNPIGAAWVVRRLSRAGISGIREIRKRLGSYARHSYPTIATRFPKLFP